MGKKKPTPDADTSEQATNTTDAGSNAGSNGGAEVNPDIEKAKAEYKAKQAARKEARKAQAEAQSTVAHSFKRLAALVTQALNETYDLQQGRDEVFEIINTGDAALETGFPNLDKPARTRGVTVKELMEQKGAAFDRFLAKEITYDEYEAIAFPLVAKIRRVQAAKKKKAEAEAAKTAQVEEGVEAQDAGASVQ